MKNWSKLSGKWKIHEIKKVTLRSKNRRHVRKYEIAPLKISLTPAIPRISLLFLHLIVRLTEFNTLTIFLITNCFHFQLEFLFSTELPRFTSELLEICTNCDDEQSLLSSLQCAKGLGTFELQFKCFQAVKHCWRTYFVFDYQMFLGLYKSDLVKYFFLNNELPL